MLRKKTLLLLNVLLTIMARSEYVTFTIGIQFKVYKVNDENVPRLLNLFCIFNERERITIFNIDLNVQLVFILLLVVMILKYYWMHGKTFFTIACQSPLSV